ncbi:MAG TPA: hypothetical protein VKU37_13260 [Verrucomicrobiae bacterium]|nr:hypothetical protein [Verrucomicrobiae bacterium]
MVGATIRAFSRDNLGEKVGIHYPCFGQRSAFFASIDRKYLMETAAKNQLEQESLFYSPFGERLFLKRMPAAAVYFGK